MLFKRKLNEEGQSPCNQNTVHEMATKAELLKQIQVEVTLLESYYLHMDHKMKENDADDNNTEVLRIQSNRIKDLYNNMFLFFPVEKTSLSEYIEFCSHNKLFIANCSNMLDTLMSRYHSDPEVYITAATYEFDYRNDVESARRYFAEGLKHHKNCKNLYVEEFWVEVQHLEKTAGASLPIAIGKYRNIIKSFEDDMEFHFILLDRAMKLSSVRELQSNVVRDMVKKYKHSEFMWQKLAKIHFDGFVYHHETEQMHYDKNYISRIRNGIQIYVNGLNENLPPKNKQDLWNFYIDCIIEIRKSHCMKKESIKNFMNEIMELAFQEAHDNKALYKKEHYIYWVKNTRTDSHEILIKAVDVIENSVELWVELLTRYMNLDSFEMAFETFQRGVRSLTSKSMPLWEIFSMYMQNTNPTMLEKFYQEGASYPFKEINTIMRQSYLEWTLIHGGIVDTRKLFDVLKNIDPPCKQLYTSMISYEKSQSPLITKTSKIRQLYNDVCNIFGKNDISIWIDCIRYEYTYGSQLMGKEIYKASLAYLEPNLVNVMKKEFGKFITKFI